MARFSLLLVSALSSASALVAHAPMMRAAAVAPVARTGAPAQMMLGSRSIGRAIRACKVPSFPKIGGGRGGTIRGCDGGDGAPPSDGASSSSSEGDDEKNGFAQVWGQYNALLDEKPLLMKGLTSLIGFALGDILAQLFIQKSDPFDYARLFRLASFGFFVHGTTSHWFYGMRGLSSVSPVPNHVAALLPTTISWRCSHGLARLLRPNQACSTARSRAPRQRSSSPRSSSTRCAPLNRLQPSIACTNPNTSQR